MVRYQLSLLLLALPLGQASEGSYYYYQGSYYYYTSPTYGDASSGACPSTWCDSPAA